MPAEQPDMPAAAGGARILLQDWTPLGRALPVRAGDAAWPLQGAALLANRQVPSFVHDSGSLSRRTAAVWLAWCAELEAAGRLPERIVALEAGMGTGAHLRLCLRAFAQAARAQGKDWADRLLVWASDVSAATVQQAFGRGMFADLQLDVRPALLDARHPSVLQSLADASQRQTLGGVHLLVGHYLLGTQPVDVFVRQRLDDGDRWRVAATRCWLTQTDQLGALTDLPLAEVVAALQQGDAALAVVLAPLLAVETGWQGVDIAAHPDFAALQAHADALEAALGADHDLLREGTVVNHAAGALQMAGQLARLLHEDGVALFHDVGVVDAAGSAVPRGYVQYGTTLAPGVAFWGWDRWYAGGFGPERLLSFTPLHDGVRDHAARLLTRAALPQTCAAFASQFDGEAVAAPLRALDGAAAAASAAEALEVLRQALADQPDDWVLLVRAGELALGLGQLALADALCSAGLQLNAAGSSELWRLRAELWLAQDNLIAASQALQEALAIAPDSPLLLLRLAQISAGLRRWPLVCRLVGEALAADRAGALRGPLQQLLEAALAATAPTTTA